MTQLIAKQLIPRGKKRAAGIDHGKGQWSGGEKRTIRGINKNFCLPEPFDSTQGKLREGSPVFEKERYFAEPALSLAMRFFAALNGNQSKEIYDTIHEPVIQ